MSEYTLTQVLSYCDLNKYSRKTYLTRFTKDYFTNPRLEYSEYANSITHVFTYEDFKKIQDTKDIWDISLRKKPVQTKTKRNEAQSERNISKNGNNQTRNNQERGLNQRLTPYGGVLPWEEL